MDAKAFKAEVRSINRQWTGLEKKTADLRVRTARNVFVAISEGHVGTGAVYENQKDYAAALGVSGGGLTGLKRLGKALEVIGCDPSDKDWTLLSSKAGTKEVGEAVDADGATKESVYAALHAAFGQDGRRIKGGEGQGADAPKDDDDKTSPAARRAGKAVDVLREVMPNLSKAEARVVLNSLSTLLAEAQDAVRKSA